MRKTSNQIFEFGEFRLDPSERLLLRAGEPISLTPKVFETLLALVESGGRLVEKDHLMKRVWPDAIVEEANLARNVWALRKALGDGNGEQAYIETVPTVGYRFVARVTERPAGMDGPVIARPPEARVPEKEDPPEAPPARLSEERRPFGALVRGALVLAAIGLMSAGVAWIWPKSVSSANGDPGLTLLTNGSHDDMGASWTNSGQIYFSRSVASTRVETWTMSADGSNQRRANMEIRNLLTGRWSPDGRKVVFIKDNVPNTVYLADTDGAHELVLPFVPGNLDWSPDASQFVYQAKSSTGTPAIFLYTLATGASMTLTSDPAGDADPSFSSDGTRVAFTSWRDGNAEIYVMRADGSAVRRVTTHPAFDNYPVFSPDGTEIAFQSNRDDEHVEVFLQRLNDSTPARRLTRSSSLTGLAPKCWSPDGTRMLVYTSQNGNEQVGVMALEPYPAQLLLSDDAADLSSPRVSADGRRVLYEARLRDRSLELRLTDLETRRTKNLFRTEPGYPIDFHLAPAWSLDNSLIAISARAARNSEIFTLQPDGSGLRNVTRHPSLDSSPAFSADGHEIVFARDAYGQAQLYRMDTNGSGQRRVTDAPGYEMSPALSPDAVHLAFAGDRESRGLDIYLLDLTRPGDEKRLAARRFHDVAPSFSPDGRQIVFIANSDGNPEIYVMNADGTGLFRVTRSQEEERAPQFSPDGKRVLFSSNRAGRFALYQVNVR